MILTLRCPNCFSSKLNIDRYHSVCSDCNDSMKLSYNKKPILISKNNILFDKNVFLNLPNSRSRYMPKVFNFFSPSINFSFKRELNYIKDKFAVSESKILIIGAGDTKKKFVEFFDNSNVFATDVDVHADVDFFSDIHNIPLLDCSVDIIICTAVLEHVISPQQSVEEIYRVLKYGGVVYSEIPFLQSVHEGAYDFTRFTMTGHISLFRKFKIISHGSTAGIFTSLYWIVEYIFILPFSGSISIKMVKLCSRIFFGWIKYFDFLTQKRSIDSASCTYVTAEKINEQLTDVDIINTYKGFRKISHE
jgi:ubiquinone/menaquinone biosynthesis C-methylase UbiE